MDGRIRQQQGGLLVLTLVVGAGIGLGLAALATFSTGQGEEAKRRITELNQTASIQYATDYQVQQVALAASSAGPIFEQNASAASLSAGSCLAKLPHGPDPFVENGTERTLGDGAWIVESGIEEIPGLESSTEYAFEHFARELTTFRLDDDSHIDLKKVNDIAYDNIFLDLWWRINYEEEFTDPDEDEGAINVPLTSYFDADDKRHLRLLAVVRDCQPTQSYCKAGNSKVAIEYRVQQIRDPLADDTLWTNHLVEATGSALQPLSIHSTDDGYWQYVAYRIDLAGGTSSASYGSITSAATGLTHRGDQTSYNFVDPPFAEDLNHEALPTFEKNGYWRIADQGATGNTIEIEIGTMRLWRQPSLTKSDAEARAKELITNDRDQPGGFQELILGEPDALVLAQGSWKDQVGDGNTRSLKRTWWGSNLGGGELITSKSTDAEREALLQTHRQRYKYNRKSIHRAGPPAPDQIYRLYTCDDNGGAARTELRRSLRRDGDEYAVSWELIQ